MKTFKVTRLTVYAFLFIFIATWANMYFFVGKYNKLKKQQTTVRQPVFIDWGEMNYIFKIDDSTIGRYIVNDGNFAGFDTLRKATILDTNDIYIPGLGYYFSLDSNNDLHLHTQSDESRPQKDYLSTHGTGSDLPAKIEGRKYIHGKIKTKIKDPKRLYVGGIADDGGGGTFVWGDYVDSTFEGIDSAIARFKRKYPTRSESMYMPSLPKQPELLIDKFRSDTSWKILDSIPIVTDTNIFGDYSFKADEYFFKDKIIDVDTASKYYYDSAGNKYQVFYDIDMSSALVPATYPPGQPHFNAYITVYAIMKDGKKYMVGEPMKGMFVPDGCFEDVPENWVKAALKSIK